MLPDFFMNSFIYLLSKHSLSIYCFLGTVSGSEDPALLWALCWWEEQEGLEV